MEDKKGSTEKVFASSEIADVPFVDLLTWTFGNPSYDLDKPLFIDASSQDRTLSYNSALATVRRLIGGLKANGLQPGDSVCLHSANNINYVLVFLAVIGAGGRFVGSNPHYTTSELTHLLTLSDVKYIFTEEDLLKNMREAAETAGICTQHTFIFDTFTEYNNTEFQSWKVLLDCSESDWIRFNDETLAKSTVAALMSTSGTTGLPKAAECSHYSQVAQSIMLAEGEKPYEVIRLLFLPQFHAFNAPLSLVAPIREGCTTYIVKRYNPKQFVDYIRTIRPTETTMVNPIIYKLLELKENERDCIQSLRAIWCGGVPLDVSVQNTFRDILHPEAIVKQVWGLTEIGWATTLKYPESDNTGSAGRLLPGVEARVIDRNGNELFEDGAQGEILLRAPSLMKGYLKNEESTKATIINGWLHTGDVGYQKAGKWYIVDRIKELIKVRGWQVSPAELEACLFSHPAVVDVAVIGVDFGDERGELPRAYVVLDPTLATTTTNEDIQNYLVGKLSRYKALDGGIVRVEGLPRGSTGKVLKNVFKEAAKQEVLEAKKAAAIANGGSGDNTLIDSDDERDEETEESDGELDAVPSDPAALSAIGEQEDSVRGLMDGQNDLDVMGIEGCHNNNVGIEIESEEKVKHEALHSEIKDFAALSIVNLSNEAAIGDIAEVNVNSEKSETGVESASLSNTVGLSKDTAAVVVTEKEVDA